MQIKIIGAILIGAFFISMPITAVVAQATTADPAFWAGSEHDTGDSSPCVTASRTLKRGMRGSDIASLQAFLIGHHVLAPGSSTGFFGKATETAVQNFQLTRSIVTSGIPATTGYGVVGPRTLAAMKSSCVSTSETARPAASGDSDPASSLTASEATDQSSPPYEVRFSYESTSALDSSQFINFGDGTSGALEVEPCGGVSTCSPMHYGLEHSYKSAGTYTATLGECNPRIDLACVPITLKTITVKVECSGPACLSKTH